MSKPGTKIQFKTVARNAKGHLGVFAQLHSEVEDLHVLASTVVYERHADRLGYYTTATGWVGHEPRKMPSGLAGHLAVTRVDPNDGETLDELEAEMRAFVVPQTLWLPVRVQDALDVMHQIVSASRYNWN